MDSYYNLLMHYLLYLDYYIDISLNRIMVYLINFLFIPNFLDVYAIIQLLSYYMLIFIFTGNRMMSQYLPKQLDHISSITHDLINKSTINNWLLNNI